MKLNYFLTLIIIFFSLEVLGQKYLLMDKLGGKQRREFLPGDGLTFRIKGENHYNTATITNLEDSLIFFDDGVINIKDIHSIRFKRRFSTAKLRVAGLGLIFVDQFNTVIIAGEPFAISSGVLIAGGSLVALSYIIELAKKTTFKINRNRRLKIIDVSYG